MPSLARTSSNFKLQTHPLLREDVTVYICSITARVQLENKITGRESQGACRQDQLIDGKPPS
jgi:hypothetical protein